MKIVCFQFATNIHCWFKDKFSHLSTNGPGKMKTKQFVFCFVFHQKFECTFFFSFEILLYNEVS